MPYNEYHENLASQFKGTSFCYLTKMKSQFVNALATLASMVQIPDGVKVHLLLLRKRDSLAYCFNLQS